MAQTAQDRRRSSDASRRLRDSKRFRPLRIVAIATVRSDNVVVPADPAAVARLEGKGGLAPRAAFQSLTDAHSDLAPWLFALAIAAAIAELFVRRRNRDATTLGTRSNAAATRGARSVTAIERVRRTQRILGAAAATQAFAWGLAAALVTVAAISFASLAIPRLRNDSALDQLIALAIGGVVAAVLLWRSRHFVSTDRVALWIEERIRSSTTPSSQRWRAEIRRSPKASKTRWLSRTSEARRWRHSAEAC